MGENIVASRLKLFVKIGSVLVFVLAIAGVYWHSEFIIGSLVLLVLCFSAEYQLINYQEKLSKRVIIPQLEGEVIDGINWLLQTSTGNEELETIFQRFEKYSTKNISRQKLLDIAFAADITIKLRNGHVYFFKQK